MTSGELKEMLDAARMTKTALARQLNVNPQQLRPSRFDRDLNARGRRIFEYAIRYVLQ